jgi:tRNA1Val (adenine37-N6)-methyltransferase
MFKFKQFSVDQTGCAMKINTDGVLLGALADADHSKTILDIGTGTGVIALMLAQRFADAQIDAVEIDEQAAQTAGRNFANSPFAERMNVYPFGFEDFFSKYADKRYDLIVSNPPFYINSLKSPQKGKEIAKHSDENFFERLIKAASEHLHEKGIFSLILPVDTAALVKSVSQTHELFVNEQINIYSYKHSEVHRQLICLSSRKANYREIDFIIYDTAGIHAAGYRAALKDFFTIF